MKALAHVPNSRTVDSHHKPVLMSIKNEENFRLHSFLSLQDITVFQNAFSPADLVNGWLDNTSRRYRLRQAIACQSRLNNKGLNTERRNRQGLFTSRAIDI